MKGLKEYIEKHGKHFTEQLAYDAALSKRWNRKQVEKAIQDMVWYNVTDSTLGDIIYLVNECYDEDNFIGYGRKHRCLSYALTYIGNYRNYGGKLFDEWLNESMQYDSFRESFSFIPYI